MTLIDKAEKALEDAAKGPWEVRVDTPLIEVCTVHCTTTFPTEDGKGRSWCYIVPPRTIDGEWYYPSEEEQTASAHLIALTPQLARATVVGGSLSDATENLLIAIGMGWDLDGVMEVAKEHLDAFRAATEDPS